MTGGDSWLLLLRSGSGEGNRRPSEKMRGTSRKMWLKDYMGPLQHIYPGQGRR